MILALAPGGAAYWSRLFQVNSRLRGHRHSSPRSRLLGQLRSPSAEAKFSPKNPTQDLRQQGSTDTSVKGCHPVGISVTPKIGNSHSACGTRFTIRLLDVRSQR